MTLNLDWKTLFDGRIYALTRGRDYPVDSPWQDVVETLDDEAHKRGVELDVGTSVRAVVLPGDRSQTDREIEKYGVTSIVVRAKRRKP